MPVKGIPKLKRRFTTYKNKQGMALARGAKAVGKYIKKLSDELIPIDTGELKSSGYVTWEGTGWGTVVEIGYSSPYAVEVHEEVWKAHGKDYNEKYAEQIAVGATYMIFRGGTVIERTYHLRRPQEQAKFLETAVRDNIDIFEGMMRKHALDLRM